MLRGLRKYATDLGEIGALLGLRLLLVIGERFVEGGPAPSEEELALASGSDPVLVRSCLQVLEDARLISVTDAHNHARALQRKPEIIKIADVLKAFHSKWYLSSRKGSENDPERYAFPLLDVVGGPVLIFRGHYKTGPWPNYCNTLSTHTSVRRVGKGYDQPTCSACRRSSSNCRSV